MNHLLEEAADVPGSALALLYAVLHRHAALLDDPQLRFAPRTDVKHKLKLIDFTN